MIRRLILVLLVLPVADLVLLVLIGKEIGVWPTLAYVVLAGLVGWVLARRQGLQVLFRMREDIAAGRPPAQGLVDAFLILVGGALLALPGVISDVLGLALMFPFTRTAAKWKLRDAIERGVRSGTLRVIHHGPDEGHPYPGPSGRRLIP